MSDSLRQPTTFKRRFLLYVCGNCHWYGATPKLRGFQRGPRCPECEQPVRETLAQEK